MSDLPPLFANLRSTDDPRLAARIRSGDTVAFTELVDTYFDASLRLAYRFLRSHDMAMDCAQAVFTRLWEHHVMFDPPGSVRSYVLSATHWQALKELRYRRRHPDTQGDPLSQHYQFPDSRDEQAVVNHITVANILDSLPERKRLALHLRYLEGLSLQEIAEVIGTSRPTVERMIHRTLDELRRRLSKLL